MRVIVREHQDVAGPEGQHFRAVDEPSAARAVGQHVEERDVLGARQAVRGRVQPELGFDAPRRRELGVEIKSAVQADRL